MRSHDGPWERDEDGRAARRPPSPRPRPVGLLARPLARAAGPPRQGDQLRAGGPSARCERRRRQDLTIEVCGYLSWTVLGSAHRPGSSWPASSRPTSTAGSVGGARRGGLPTRWAPLGARHRSLPAAVSERIAFPPQEYPPIPGEKRLADPGRWPRPREIPRIRLFGLPSAST